VVAAERQHEAVDDLEVDLPEQRDSFAMQRIALVEALAGSKELAGVVRPVGRAERRLQRRQAERPGRKLLNQQVGIGAELAAVDQLVTLIDVLADVERAEKQVDTVADLARQPQLLRQRANAEVLEVRIDQIGAGKV